MQKNGKYKKIRKNRFEKYGIDWLTLALKKVNLYCIYFHGSPLICQIWEKPDHAEEEEEKGKEEEVEEEGEEEEEVKKEELTGNLKLPIIKRAENSEGGLCGP